MNLNNLTPEEIIRYIENGVITEDIPSAVFIKVVEKLQNQLSDVIAEMKGMEDDYQDGWDD